MSSDTKDLAQLKRRAAEAGLTRLTDAHLAQFRRAKASIEKRKKHLTEALTVADEPSHVFSLVKDA